MATTPATQTKAVTPSQARKAARIFAVPGGNCLEVNRPQERLDDLLTQEEGLVDQPIGRHVDPGGFQPEQAPDDVAITQVGDPFEDRQRDERQAESAR